MGAIPAVLASLESEENRAAPAISPTSLAAVSGPQPGSATSCGQTSSTSWLISSSSRRASRRYHVVEVIKQQAHIQLTPRKYRGGQSVDAFSNSRPRHRQRIDRIRLAALARRTASTGHHPRRDPHHLLAPPHQQPLQPARYMSAILDRPYPIRIAQPPHPRQRIHDALRCGGDRPHPHPPPTGHLHRHQRVRRLVCVRSDHDHVHRPLHR